MKFTEMTLLTLASFLVTTACSSAGRDVLNSVEELPTPALEYSAQPNLARSADGALYLSWIEEGGEAPTIKFASKTADGWSEPRTIVQSDKLLVNWADFPSLYDLGGGVLAAHWPTLTEGEGYDVSLALSRDSGASW